MNPWSCTNWTKILPTSKVKTEMHVLLLKFMFQVQSSYNEQHALCGQLSQIIAV